MTCDYILITCPDISGVLRLRSLEEDVKLIANSAFQVLVSSGVAVDTGESCGCSRRQSPRGAKWAA